MDISASGDVSGNVFSESSDEAFSKFSAQPRSSCSIPSCTPLFDVVDRGNKTLILNATEESFNTDDDLDFMIDNPAYAVSEGAMVMPHTPHVADRVGSNLSLDILREKGLSFSPHTTRVQTNQESLTQSSTKAKPEMIIRWAESPSANPLPLTYTNQYYMLRSQSLSDHHVARHINSGVLLGHPSIQPYSLVQRK